MQKPIQSDILDAIDNIRSESGVGKDVVFKAIEKAFADGAKKKYGTNLDIHVNFDRKTGHIRIYRKLLVVDKIENDDTEILLSDARHDNKDVKLGEYIYDELPPVHLHRNYAHQMSSIITTYIKNEEKEMEYNSYKDRVGEIVEGVIKKSSYRELFILVGKTECIMDARNIMPTEKPRIGDKITACIQEVRRDNVNQQVILSRTSDEFLISLFNSEIPECADGIVKVERCSREPGFRAKVAVSSGDPRADAVGTCIGPKGMRIKSIMEKLNGERIDVIEYTSDMDILIERALSPAKQLAVYTNDRSQSAEVVVNDENFSLAVGRKGQNVRLASRLTGYKIDIVLESQKQEKAIEKFNNATQLIASGLNLDEVAAQVIVASGFDSISSIANADVNDIASIDGFDLETAEIIKQRADEYTDEENKRYHSILHKLGVDMEILELPGLSQSMIVNMASNSNDPIKSIKDVADLSVDEFIEIVNAQGEEVSSDKISYDEAEMVINIAKQYIYGK